MERWRVGALAVVLALVAGCGTPVAEPVLVPSADPVALQPIDTDAGTLLAPAGIDPSRRTAWVDRMTRTIATLGAAGLGPLDDGWDGRLLVELPATADDYAELAGADGHEAAAVTRCVAGASPITINPRIVTEKPDYLDGLLLHEAVHAATGSACTDAPLWVEEGLAEWLTAQYDPASQQANQQWLAHALTAGLPSGLPEDAAFTGTATQLSASYALAVFAVGTTVERLGHERAMAYFAAPDDATTARITQWYLDGLQDARPAVR